MQMAREGPDYFGDLIPQSKNGDKASSSAAFAEDAVLMSTAFDGTRISGEKKTASMPGTPMVSVGDRSLNEQYGACIISLMFVSDFSNTFSVTFTAQGHF